jgi:integrase
MRRVRAGGFRTRRERERIVEKYIVPALGSRAMSGVRRDDVTEMLDQIASASMADQVLAIFGAIARWHHTRHEDYHPPLTKNMWRVTERHRKRILTDPEIKTIWNSAGGTFGAMVKLALLTAQRRDKIRTLRWDDIRDGCFPLGILLGPSTRAWPEPEVAAWLASRPSEQSRQTKERAAKSIKARKDAA